MAMSQYEMMDYDNLLRRIGITPGQTWFCGNNPPPEWSYEEAGFAYNDVRASYTGRNQGHGTLCLTEDINVNGLLLNHRDRNNTIWLCTGIEGWWTLPPADIEDVPKPYWDGSMLTTGRYLARNITISGCFIPPDASLVWYNREALIRCSAIVRGVGLLAMCGNDGPTPTLDSLFSDPSKMATIQMADVPLIETLRPNGFTQFSLSFRCSQPTKLSLREKSTTIPVEDGGVTRKRKYQAISEPASEPGATTEYAEVMQIGATTGTRDYAGLTKVNFDALIASEEYAESQTPSDIAAAYEETTSAKTVVLYNDGNYFAFPIFVFSDISNVTKDKVLTLHNLTTDEKMQIQGNVSGANQLIIDTNMRRVTVADPSTSPASWVWNQRNMLTLTSDWISLAPGANTIVLSKPTPPTPPPAGYKYVTTPVDPEVHWRDTWIG